jgi:two-component system chemotaxis response regulator CheB
MIRPPIQVLIVEDSPVSLALLAHILGADPDIRILGTAANGEDALDFLARKKPDVITMDVKMPKIDGYETTRRIMETQPVPIVIVTASHNRDAVVSTFKALEAGALAVVGKPEGIGHPEHAEAARKLVEIVKLMSEVKVVRRYNRLRRTEPAEAQAVRRPAAAPQVEIIAIGVSTGGPPVLQTILSKLPKDLPVPVLITQHIAAGFLEGMTEWLRQTTGFKVLIAAQGESLRPGHAYLAPDGFHLGVDGAARFALSKAPPENGLRPAVGYMFRSVAEHYGGHAIGVLLTGMGRDGADDLKVLQEKGAVTIAQDKESSLVHGMPGEAIALGAADYVLPPDRIAALLASLVPPL